MLILQQPLTRAAVLALAQGWLESPERAAGRRVVLPIFLVFRHGGQFASEWKMVRRARKYSDAFDRMQRIALSMAWGGLALVAILESREPDIWFFHVCEARHQKRKRQCQKQQQQAHAPKSTPAPNLLTIGSLPLFANAKTDETSTVEP